MPVGGTFLRRVVLSVALAALALQSGVAGAFRCAVARSEQPAPAPHAGPRHAEPAAAPTGHHGAVDHTAGRDSGSQGPHQGHRAVCDCTDGCCGSPAPAPRALEVAVRPQPPTSAPTPTYVSRRVLAPVAVPYLLPPGLAPPTGLTI